MPRPLIVADDVGPRLAAIARDLHVAIVGAHPDDLAVLWRFGDGVNGGVHFGGGVIHRDAAGFFLLLFFRIVGSQVGRNAIPGLAVIARTEQELRADVNGALFVGAHLNGRVPVEAQFLFAVIRLGLMERLFVRITIHSSDFAALRFGINVSRGRKDLRTSRSHRRHTYFPSASWRRRRDRRIADPRTVVLQAAIDVVRIGVVHAHVIELRDRAGSSCASSGAAVLAAPEAAVVAGDRRRSGSPGSIQTSWKSPWAPPETT